MFGGQHNKQFVEQVYLSNSKEMEMTLDMFLTGNLPKEGGELHVIIEKEKETSDQKADTIDTTYDQIQEQKKKSDLKKYILSEYGGILGAKTENVALKGNQYYQNHLRALEMQREEEQ